MFKKIVVPVDMAQLEKGEVILKKAMALLDAGGEILLLNVTENLPGYLAIEVPPDFIDRNVTDATAQLTAMNAASGANARILVRIGSPASEILTAAGEFGADLVIVASHRPNLSNYLLGSTADRVVRHATCSVLIDR